MSIPRPLNRLLILGALPALAQVDPAAYFKPQAVRVLILSGRNNHDWRTETPHLRRILDSTGRFDVRVTEEPAGLNAAAIAPYDVIVSDYCGPRWGASAETALEQFVRSGRGFVVVHAASYPFGTREVLAENMTNTRRREPPWPEYARMAGASWTEEPRTGHGPRHAFTVEWKDTVHPIARGLPPSFVIHDELYHNFRLEPGIHVLASAFDAPAMQGAGRHEPLLWTLSYGKGRVFHTALGHDLAARSTPGFMASFARGVEWAATGEVTLPTSIDPHAPISKAVRLQLVTGGHDHEPSLYSVFDEYKDLNTAVNPHPIAFRGDLRKRYDVLVFYDLVQELDEMQRRNLQAFAESGRGIVVLHHALANFNSWPWWRDLIGAEYLLKPEEGRPASTFLHDVDLDVSPASRHPVLAGISAFRVNDETYKGMWFAPNNQVLLRTAHESSDGPVAWISSYAQSRVAVIQLGHGSLAHRHPVWRRLVHNAILWSAGRSN